MFRYTWYIETFFFISIITMLVYCQPVFNLKYGVSVETDAIQRYYETFQCFNNCFEKFSYDENERFVCGKPCYQIIFLPNIVNLP